MSKISVSLPKRSNHVNEKIDKLKSVEDIKLFLKQMYSEKSTPVYKHTETDGKPFQFEK